MNRIKLFIATFSLFTLFESCHRDPKMNIDFAFVNLSKMDNKKAIRIAIKNNTDKNVFILASYLVNKIGSIHPCRIDNLGEYSKISSHKGNDCTMNPGILLFKYLQTKPFNKIDHVKLRNVLSKNSKKDGFDFSLWWFGYMNNGFDIVKSAPSFIFIDSKKTTYIYFAIDEELKRIDEGFYKFEWYSKDRLQRIISPVIGKTSFKKIIKGKDINSYEFYDGDVKVHPFQIKL